MSIGDRIQSLRKSKGISQEELADKIGVSRQAVSKWESEQSTPDIDKIILLSEYFETTTDYLLKGIEPTKQSEKKWSCCLEQEYFWRDRLLTAQQKKRHDIILSCLIYGSCHLFPWPAVLILQMGS